MLLKYSYLVYIDSKNKSHYPYFLCVIFALFHSSFILSRLFFIFIPEITRHAFISLQYLLKHFTSIIKHILIDLTYTQISFKILESRILYKSLIHRLTQIQLCFFIFFNVLLHFALNLIVFSSQSIKLNWKCG